MVFGAQEAGARHGQVHPEHTEEQQAADGPPGGHGLSRLGTDGPGGERVFRQRALPAPCASELTWVGAQQTGCGGSVRPGIDLLAKNAKTYNEPGSQVFKVSFFVVVAFIDKNRYLNLEPIVFV